MTKVIDARNIKKEYDMGTTKVRALNGISLVLNKGEMISIMGPSGSGKSTLMHILGCLDVMTSGEYYLDGINVSELSDNELSGIRNKKIGFIFQSFNLLPHMNVKENVLLPVIYNDEIDIKEAEERALNLLEYVGLRDRLDHFPAQLSGGEKQRVAIVRALVNNPSVILADEPTGNLDSKTGTEILDILKNLNENGVSEIIVTHDPTIANMTKRIVHIKDGVIISEELKE